MKGVHIEGKYTMAEKRKNIIVRRTAQVLTGVEKYFKEVGVIK